MGRERHAGYSARFRRARRRANRALRRPGLSISLSPIIIIVQNYLLRPSEAPQTLAGRFPPSGRACKSPAPNPSRNDLATKLGRGQRDELLLISVAGRGSGKPRRSRRMSVDFGDPLRQMRDQPRKPRTRHGAAPGQAGNLVGRSDACPIQTRALKTRPTIQGGRRGAGTGAVDPRQDRPRLQRHANVFHPKFRRHGENCRENRGM